MEKYMYFLVYAFLLISLSVRAQVEPVSAEAEEGFKQRVKILDEFIERFNYEGGPHGQLPPDSLGKLRQQLLLTLFDEQWLANLKPAEKADIEGFVRQVADPRQPIHLRFQDTGWYALSKWDATLNGKPAKVDVLLVPKFTPELVTWQIANVQSSAINFSSKGNTTPLSPVSHDLDFMGLKKVMATGKGGLHGYASEGYCPDNRPVFFYLVESGQLKLLQAGRPIYIFTQIPGWIFEARYFERPGDNTGWRIAALRRADEAEKKAYKQQLLGQGL